MNQEREQREIIVHLVGIIRENLTLLRECPLCIKGVQMAGIHSDVDNLIPAPKDAPQATQSSAKGIPAND